MTSKAIADAQQAAEYRICLIMASNAVNFSRASYRRMRDSWVLFEANLSIDQLVIESYVNHGLTYENVKWFVLWWQYD